MKQDPVEQLTTAVVILTACALGVAIAKCGDRDMFSLTDKQKEGRPERVQKDPGGPTRTRRSLAAATDVNAIVRRYRSTRDPAVLLERPLESGHYGAFDQAEDFMAMKIKLARTQELFEQLPSEVRDFCANDPAKFLELVHDPAMEAKCVELGLRIKRPEPEPQPAPAPAPAPAPNPLPTA